MVSTLQSALTGESLPVTKKSGDGVFSGSICKHGEIEAVVISTGVHSFLGRAAFLVDSTQSVGHFQQVNDHFSNYNENCWVCLLHETSLICLQVPSIHYLQFMHAHCHIIH